MKRFVLLLPMLVAACLVTIDESKIDSALVPDATPDVETEAATIVDAGQDVRRDAPEEPDTGPPCDCQAKQVCRFSQCVLPTSCKELLKQHADTKTGVYDLAIDSATVPAYCDMDTDGGGWTLVFKLNAGLTGNPASLFSGDPVNDTVATHATPLASSAHYVSRLLGRWNVPNQFIVDRARARLGGGTTGATKLVELVFDATASTRTSFFSKASLLSSPWPDLGEPYYFSVRGHDEIHRNFFIHKTYSTCSTDEGWLNIHGTQVNPPDPVVACPYENPAANIRMFYSSKTAAPSAQKWDPTPPEGKVFTIFAR